jgi:hypothetical protein
MLGFGVCGNGAALQQCNSAATMHGSILVLADLVPAAVAENVVGSVQTKSQQPSIQHVSMYHWQ